MKVLFEGTCPLTVNREFKRGDDIVITSDRTLLGNDDAFVACVHKYEDLVKAVHLYAEGYSKVTRRLAISERYVGIYIDTAISTSTIINIIENNCVVCTKNVKTELDKQLLKAQFSDVKYINIDYIAVLLAAQIPHRLSIEEAVSKVLAANSQLDTDLVRAAVTEKVDATKARVRAIKSVSVDTHAVDSIDGIAEQIINRQGVYIIKTPTGSRKTIGVLQPIIESAISVGQRPTLMAHRRSIIASAVNIDGMTHYEQIIPGTEADIQALKVVVNSCIKLNLEQFLSDSDVLVIDEASQTLDHVFTGSVEDRQGTHAKLLELIGNTSTVVLADADANDNLIELVRQAGRTDITIFEMAADHSDITVNVTDADAISKEIFDAVAAGQRTLIAVDSIRKVDELAIKLSRAFEHKAVLKITSKSIENAEQADFLADPNSAAVRYDVVIYSPVITSSVSITNRAFDSHFAIFTGVLAPSDCVQMMRRDRTAREFTVGLKNSQKKAFGRDTAGAIVEQIDMLDDETMMKFDTLGAMIDADKAFFRNHFCSAFIYNLELDNFNISVIEADNMTIDVGRSLNKSARQLENADYANRVLASKAASRIDVMRAKTNGLEMTEDVAYQLERYDIERLLCKQEINKDDIKLWNRGQLKKIVRNMEIAIATSKSIEAAEAYDKLLAKRDRAHVALRHRFYNLILKGLNINLKDKSAEFTTSDAQTVLNALVNEKTSWDRLGHTVATRRWVDNPQAARTINKLLKEIFAIKTTAKQTVRDGVRQRIYVVDGGDLLSLVEVIERRLAADAVSFPVCSEMWEVVDAENGSSAA